MRAWVCVISLWIAACGYERHLPAPLSEPRVVSSQESSPCPFAFPESRLCAAVYWLLPPQIDRPVEFRIKVWDPLYGDPQSGPFVDPPEAIRARFVMSCCETVTPVSLKRIQSGIYLSKPVLLVQGAYWHVLEWGPERASAYVVVP